MNSIQKPRAAGLSLVEMVILVSVIAILATLGISRVGMGSISGAKEVKLEQDLRTLNSAVSAYLASGGNLAKASTPGEVLARLKTRASEEQQRRLPGLGGSFIDARVEFEMQNESESKSDSLRLFWNPEKVRFEPSRTGGTGIRSLGLGASGVDENARVEDERLFGMEYSEKGSWIWDYQDSAPPSRTGSSAVPTYSPADSSPLVPSVPSPGVVPKNTLQPPVFSISGGRYPAYDFNLSLDLSDPNPVGSGRIYYSVNYGSWSEYSSGSPFLSVPPESSIKAQVVPVNPGLWSASQVVDELYHSYISGLVPPSIDFDEPFFMTSGIKTVNTIHVTLTDGNAPGTSLVQYRLVPVPGGSGPTTSFQPYGGTFAVSSTDYPQGFGVRAYASAVIVGYEDSRENSRFATPETGLFGGHLDLDTSVTVAEVGSGSTEAHTHDITGKYGISSLDFFSIPESSQIELDEAVTNSSQMFKITVVNADLSPGMGLIIDYEVDGETRTLDTTVTRYDDTPAEELQLFSLGGTSGSARLKRLQVVMSQDVIHQAGVIPTNTGDVRSNILGKTNEWRNGALSVQAVAMAADGSAAYTADSRLSSGSHGAAQSGLLWEATLFWHWDGDSYHEENNHYIPGQFESVSDHIRD